MKVKVELMEAGFFFNKGSGMHPEKPLVNVTWVKEDGKAYGSIETIENIFNPIANYVNIPEEVRLVVVEKYGNELKEYCQEVQK
jgi:hypothetical protein|tara:strand:+ start:268 stop:519 length:252 start_codon:yes stop_codon:yes gene_type:complete